MIVDGELAYQRGFGVRDLATGAPVDADTVFRIASMTKSFTALAVLGSPIGSMTGIAAHSPRFSLT